jgi:hypothetical protein
VVADERADVVQAGLLVDTPVALGGVRRQQVPLGRAGAERVRRHDLDAALEQVVPVLDPLGVALAHDDGHDGAEWDAAVLVGVPRRVDQPGIDESGDVGLDGEVHEVRLGAGLDLAGLIARGAIGLLELNALAGLARLEGRDELVVPHLRDGVREEVHRAALCAGRSLGGG